MYKNTPKTFYMGGATPTDRTMISRGVFFMGGSDSSSQDWSGKPSSWPDIRKNLIPNSIRLLADERYPLGFTATATGGYTVKIDGELKGTYASGAQCSIPQTDWPKGHINSLTAYGATEQSGTPTPTTPQDIISNNGAIKYSANMANVNAQTVLLGYYISAQGVVTADANNWIYKNFIPVKPNTAYTLSLSSSVYYVSISEYSTTDDSGFIVRKAGSTGSNTQLTITTGATTNFIRFGTNIDRTEVTLEEVLAINWMLNEGDTALPYAPYSENGIYTYGTIETIQDSLSNTATAEMLLKVENYQDTQEVLSGHITRNVGIKVLDGTEGWQLATNTNLVQFYTSSTQGVIANNVSIYSTITSYGCTVATRTEYDFGCYSGNSGNLCFQMKGSATLTTLTAWTTFLTDQYNAGTPVIIVYPLATPTTETVTPQALTGTTATVTAGSISDLQITYTQSSGGYPIDYPTGAETAHIVDIYPTTEGNNITAFNSYRVAANGIEQQGVLWAHFNITNSINLRCGLADDWSHNNQLLTAVTAKNNVIKMNTSLISCFHTARILEYLPVLDGQGNIIDLYAAFYLCLKIEKIDIKNTKFKVGANTFNGCISLKQVPKGLDYSEALEMQDYIASCYSLEDTILDVRNATGLEVIQCQGWSGGRVDGLKGLRVSSSAPFSSLHTPQINVSYTGMDRSALVQLFNDLPTVNAGQIINVTGCTGSEDLTGQDVLIATNKGWTVTGGPVFTDYYAYTDANGNSVYTTDSSISDGSEVSLENASIVGTLTEDNGIYSGFSKGNYIKLNTISPTTSLEFKIAFTPNSTSPGDILRSQPDSAGILLRNKSCYLSSNGSSWNVLSSFDTGLTYTANVLNYIKITWNNTDGIYTFWQSLDGENWTEKNSSASGKAAVYWNNTQTLGACSSYAEYLNGNIDITKTNAIVDGITINFSSPIAPSILYNESLQELNPQPTFEKGKGVVVTNLKNGGIIIPVTQCTNSFELCTHFKTNNSWPQLAIVGHSSDTNNNLIHSLYIQQYNSNPAGVWLSSNGDSDNIVEAQTIGITFSTNTEYWLKVTWDGSHYRFYRSYDGVTFTQGSSISSSMPLYFNTGNLYLGNEVGTYKQSSVLNTYYLDGTYAICDGVKTFDGNTAIINVDYTTDATISGIHSNAIQINNVEYIRTPANDLLG